MQLSVGTSESGVGIAPATLPCAQVTGDGFLGNVVTMFAVPVFEPPFPASGLPLGIDMEKLTGQCQELLASGCFRVQSQLRLDVQPGMEPAALDNGIWPDGLNGLEHTLLAITDHVDWCRNE